MAECNGLKDLYLCCLNYGSINLSEIYKNDELSHTTIDQYLPIIITEDQFVTEKKV